MTPENRGSTTILSIFFFSSRRRHTRSYGDWSSDVCSSDLTASDRTCAIRAVTRVAVRMAQVRSLAVGPARRDRSEERRGGRECRSAGLVRQLWMYMTWSTVSVKVVVLRLQDRESVALT